MLKIEDKKVLKQYITEAVCDKCERDISSITANGLTSTIDSLGLDGMHINYTAGYGTELDGTNMQITLCTYCIHEMVTNYKGLINCRS